ncbi:GNAT family N-acetyltransferase [Miniphocaeibacter massiliensis]|uniref:GNAT family N-acetyltransferase n=1 Tax=Miniphocaeibacter massiliensis TaxID=2041841 RepID=UPI000C1C761C|nr:GNAT family N-acetyltransferase [Miniphocaeibacter massiliensis]
MGFIRAMNINDYYEAVNLWKNTTGMGLRNIDDTYEGIKFFIEYNPELSIVYEEDGHVEGTILCGFDGKRAYLYHVAISEKIKGRGIGKKMVLHIEKILKEKNINGIALVAFCKNEIGNRFWDNLGYNPRKDLYYRDKNINQENTYIKNK